MFLRMPRAKTHIFQLELENKFCLINLRDRFAFTISHLLRRNNSLGIGVRLLICAWYAGSLFNTQVTSNLNEQSHELQLIISLPRGARYFIFS